MLGFAWAAARTGAIANRNVASTVARKDLLLFMGSVSKVMVDR